MRVLVGCEFSGVVRDAIRRNGHDAISCDLEPTEKPGPHLRRDILTVLRQKWDAALFFPPCTYLTVAANAWQDDVTFSFDEEIRPRWEMTDEAYLFVMRLWDTNIPKVCIENPVGVLSSMFRTPDQIVQPHYFGVREFKKICFWRRNLPPLIRTHRLRVPKPGTPMHKKWSRVHRAAPGPLRWKERSRFWPEIAAVMADTWFPKEK